MDTNLNYKAEYYEPFVVGILPEGTDKLEPQMLKKTTNPSADLQSKGMVKVDFYQTRLKMALGEDKEMIARGLKVKKVITGDRKFRTHNFFKNVDSFYFERLANDIAEGRYEPLASEPNVGFLPDVYIKGFFAKKTTPFRFYLTSVGTDGNIKYLMSSKKHVTPDGKVTYPQAFATNNTVEIFVPWENDESGRYENVQALLDKEVERMRVFSVIADASVTKEEDVFVQPEEEEVEVVQTTVVPPVTAPVTAPTTNPAGAVV